MEKVQINENNYSKINSFLLMLYIFIPTLTLPLKDISNSGLSVWVLTAIILIISFYINRDEINLMSLVIIYAMIVLFITNYLLFPYKDETTYLLVEFIKFGAIPLYLAATSINTKEISKYWLVFGLLNFFILFFYFDQINEREFSYMTFGRHMSLSFIIFSFYFYNNRFKKTMFLLMLITMITIFIFGNRSSIVVVLLILLYFEIRELLSKRSLSQYFKLTSMIVVLTYLLLNLKEIVYKLIYFLETNNINSYSFRKLTTLFENNTESFVSGRDGIYAEALNLIYLNNLMPKGIGYYQHVTGEVYPHNIFLDIIITFGIVGVIATLSVGAFGLVRYSYISDFKLKEIIVILSIYQFTILTLSGTFWSEPILWMIFGLLLSKKVSRKNTDFILYRRFYNAKSKHNYSNI